MNTRVPTILTPLAGYVPDWAQGANPGPIGSAERALLRDLAADVAQIAAEPQQAEKRRRWHRHCRLEKAGPMLLVFPEDSWVEIIGEDRLQVADPFWRQWEWYLRHLIYRHSRVGDDFVVEPQLPVTTPTRLRCGWGLEPRTRRPVEEKGSYAWDPPIKDPADIDELTHPSIEIDREAALGQVDALGEMFGDVLDVTTHCRLPASSVYDTAAELRGIEQLMLDMYDRPA